MPHDRFGARSTLEVGSSSYEIYRLDALQARFDVARLPFSLKILLENLLRHEGSGSVTAADVESLARWDARAEPSVEIAFTPARVLMQDFTGVPAVVDLAAMRDAIAQLGGDPARINPLVPAELVIDHSVQVDVFATPDAFRVNAERELERNRERYAFLRWGQTAFDRFAVVPPDTGIVHQVNLEYLARVVFPGPADLARADGGHEVSGDSEGAVGAGVSGARGSGAGGSGAGGSGAGGSGAGGSGGATGSTDILPQAYPDTLVGTDSHTTMVGGLGVLGWGVGGIEAEAAMLGQPMSMLIPQVLGFRLHGELPDGATATDLVLTVTEMLRSYGVVGKFVEFYGAGLAGLPIADRATIGNMSPEFGSTCAIFPIDSLTLDYLRLSGRSPAHIELVETYARAQGLWHDEHSDTPTFSDEIELDLGSVQPSLAGPKRPQDRVALNDSQAVFREALRDYVPSDGDQPDAQDEAVAESYPASDPPAGGMPGHAPLTTTTGAGARPQLPEGGMATLPHNGTARSVTVDGQTFELDHGHVVIAAITSCTNTSNPSVMVGAGLLARNAVARGLRRQPWVKTSLAPGSRVVTEYLDRAGLTEPLQELGFGLVAYGCTTCIGNSGPLAPEISQAVADGDLAAVSVLSGNRNFEGRINPDVKMNYLASPPLCVAYALAGTMDIDIVRDPLGQDPDGSDVYLRDIWPDAHEIAQIVGEAVRADMFRDAYGDVFTGDERWRALETPEGELFAWDADSTYVRPPPFFDSMPTGPERVSDVQGARVLALLGDSVTTDHISPAGAIKRDGPAGQYLQEQGVSPRDFNSYGSRRGNHEVMMRGTFANIRLRNLLGSGPTLPEGGVTRYLGPANVTADRAAAVGDSAEPAPGQRTGTASGEGELMSIYDAAMRYAQDDVPLIVLAGAEYGSGSSRDWAAKGTRLLGVRAVIAQSFERIHRANLIGMGVLPLQFPAGQEAQSLGLTGEETFAIEGLAEAMNTGTSGSDETNGSGRPGGSSGSDDAGRSGGALPREVRVTAQPTSGEPIRFDARVRIDTPREADYYRHGGILQYVLRMLLTQ